MQENVPLVGIMMPVYNGGTTIKKSLMSIAIQTFCNWVCVIVNDGSTDNTLEILNDIADERFKIINLKNNVGRGAARKIAVEKLLAINCKYICMLDADDVYLPNKLFWQVNYMENNVEIALMSASLGIIDNEFNLIRVVDNKNKKKIYYTSYKEYIPVPFASSIIRSNQLNGVFFDKKMRFSEDQDFLIRFLRDKTYVFVCELCYLYNRQVSFSISKFHQSLKSEIYTLKKLNVSNSIILKKKSYNVFKIGGGVFLN